MPTTKEGLLEIRRLQIEVNRADMARAQTAVRLFQEFSADHQARRAADPRFTLAPAAELMVEHLQEGRLDLWRAKQVTDALREDLDGHAEAIARFSELMEPWFAAGLPDPDGLVTKTITQIRNRVHYVVTKVLGSQIDEKFKRRHRQRRVTSTDTGDGMAALTIDTDAVSVKLAQARLDMLARHFRSRGDERTLEQLRTDLAIGLLTGLGPEITPDQQVGRWARPVINVTVPIQTLMGLSDEPGVMGEQTLPPSLVRHLAAQPESTWYRMLTDPSRHGVELSTTSYKPTAPITREVIALWSTCFAPTCSKPASECELDHNERYPEGETRTGNLGPDCKQHHISKHAPGAGLRRNGDGSLRYRLRSGMTHLISPTELPVCQDPNVAPLWERLLEIQPNLADLTTALEDLAASQHKHADNIIGQAEELTRLEADYRASYPNATDEDIDHWIWGDEHPDPAYDPPPILKKARFTFDAPTEDNLSALTY